MTRGLPGMTRFCLGDLLDEPGGEIHREIKSLGESLGYRSKRDFAQSQSRGAARFHTRRQNHPFHEAESWIGRKSKL